MFAAIMLRNSTVDPREFATAESLVAALTPYGQADKTGFWQDRRAMIVQALTWNTASSKHEQVPEICPETGRIIAAWTRLDNRADLCAALSLSDHESLTDPQIILAAYRTWGEGCADKLEGDFSFLIYDPASHQTFSARDTTGAMPFFFWVNDAVFVCATTAAVFPQIKHLDVSVREEWLVRYLASSAQHHVDTAFSGVQKLPPAHTLTIDAQSPSDQRRYFAFEDTAKACTKREARWVDDYRAQLKCAIDARLRSDYFIGAESSGGLDSSSIVALAAQNLPHAKPDFHCFGLCHLEGEASVIAETSMLAGIEQTHVITTPPYIRPAEITERAIRCLGYPPDNGLASLYYLFFEECQHHGIRTMLSGYGGDHVVSAQASRLFYELYDAKAYRALLQELPGNAAVRALRWLRIAGRGRGYLPGNATAGAEARKMAQSLVLRDDCLQDHRIEALLCERITGPRTRGVNSYCLEKIGPVHGAMVPSRLEGCQLMANSYRVTYRWPLLDRRLLSQFLATPAIEKRHRAYGRYLHRRAIESVVPQKVVWHTPKVLGSINQAHRQSRRFDIAELHDLPAAVAAIVDLPKLQKHAEQLQKHLDGDLTLPPSRYTASAQSVRRVLELRTFLSAKGLSVSENG